MIREGAACPARATGADDLRATADGASDAKKNYWRFHAPCCHTHHAHKSWVVVPETGRGACSTRTAGGIQRTRPGWRLHHVNLTHLLPLAGGVCRFPGRSGRVLPCCPGHGRRRIWLRILSWPPDRPGFCPDGE